MEVKHVTLKVASSVDRNKYQQLHNKESQNGFSIKNVPEKGNTYISYFHVYPRCLQGLFQGRFNNIIHFMNI